MAAKRFSADFQSCGEIVCTNLNPNLGLTRLFATPHTIVFILIFIGSSAIPYSLSLDRESQVYKQYLPFPHEWLGISRRKNLSNVRERRGKTPEWKWENKLLWIWIYFYLFLYSWKNNRKIFYFCNIRSRADEIRDRQRAALEHRRYTLWQSRKVSTLPRMCRLKWLD